MADDGFPSPVAWGGGVFAGRFLLRIWLGAGLLVAGAAGEVGAVISHPIMVVGWWLMLWERILHRPGRGGAGGKDSPYQSYYQLAAGVIYIILAVVPGFLLFFLSPPPLLQAMAIGFMVAGGSLFIHVAAVQRGLAASLGQGQFFLQKIVSRDASQLDKYGVARSGLESLSENLSDGVVAPALFYFCFGLGGMVIYKIINTADSMVGYRSERYFYFGKAAARLDDIVNFIPARLTAVLYLAAGLVLAGRGAPWRRLAGWGREVWGQAPRHASPNSGWPEAALAAVLAVKLGGRRVYPGNIVKTTTIGLGRGNLAPSDIGRGLRLTAVAVGVMVVGLAIYAASPWWMG